MLELFEKKVGFFVVLAIAGGFLDDVHFIIVRFPFEILEAELFSVVLVAQGFLVSFKVMELIQLMASLLFIHLSLDEHLCVELIQLTCEGSMLCL